MNVQLKGFKEVQELLRGLGSEAITRKVLLSAERDALKPVVSDMKTNLAGATEQKTGNLASSIGVKALRGKSKASTTSLAGMRTGGKFKGYHGHIIDQGTVERKYKTRRKISFTGASGKVVAFASGTGRVQATHFAQNAIDSNRQGVLDNFERSVVDSMNRYIKRKAKSVV
jgi:hypothetical protein